MIPELPKLVAENIERFTGRVWLLPKVLRWWDHSDERIFLLTGGPGAGKSMILAWLAGHGPPPEERAACRQLARLRALVKAAYFCRTNGRTNSPQAFAESIAVRLTGTVKGFGDALAASFTAGGLSIVGTAHANTAAPGSSLAGVSINHLDVGALEERSFDLNFVNPLKKLYASGHAEPMLLLVDALDEALNYSGVTLPDLLSRLDDLPACVRILATTRDDPRVLTFFRSIQPLDLIRDADAGADDVLAYAEQRLATLAAINDGHRATFAKRVSEQSCGVFLYAAMVLDELLGRPSAELPDLATYPLPKDLSGLYHNFLTRELVRNEERWFELYEPLLGLITVAQGEGLAAQRLTQILGKDIRAALRTIKQYLSGELPEGPFRPFHKSFADFLLEDEDNIDYHIDAASMHRRIADHLWTAYHEDLSKCDRYALFYLATHLGETGAWTRVERLLLDPSYVRALCDLSNKSLSDVYSGAHKCLSQMSEGPHHGLLSQLITVTGKQRHFAGRINELREIEWFLETDASQQLLVVGDPGIGKSALVSQVWLRHIDLCLLEVVEPRMSLHNVIERLYSGLLPPDPGKSGMGPKLNFSRGLWSDLFSYLETSGKRVYIIIDELDATRRDSWEEMWWKAPLSIPRNLKIVWVSRRTPDLLHLFDAVRVLELSGVNRLEMRQFIQQTLGRVVPEELLERIEEQSGGHPLYTKLLVDELSAGKLDSAMLLPPLSLSAMYAARAQALEKAHSGIRDRLASLVGVIVSQHPRARIRSEEVPARFDAEELASIEASGLFVVERDKQEVMLSIAHASTLHFLLERYGIG